MSTVFGDKALALTEIRELRELLDPAAEPLTDEKLMRRDLLLYGTCYGRRRPDGSLEHLPATDIVVSTRSAVRPR